MHAEIEARMEWLQGIVREGPTPLFATVSGAHSYGFESPDSDYDLRGAFVAPLRDVLRLRPIKDSVSILETRDGLELDWVAHDLLKFCRLMAKHNGSVLEMLYSPLVVYGNDWHEELKDIGRGCITKRVYYHYNGFSKTQRKLLEKGEETVKRLLYCYRGLMTGIHVLRSGEVEADLNRLVDEIPVMDLVSLIDRKRSGDEKGSLDKGEAERHLPALTSLQERLDLEFEKSDLPEAATSLDALDDYVVRARMELGGE